MNKGIPQVALLVMNLPAGAGDLRDTDSIPRSGRSPGERHGNPLQYCCLENPMDRGAWWATVQGVTKSWTRLNEQAQRRKQKLHNTTTRNNNYQYSLFSSSLFYLCTRCVENRGENTYTQESRLQNWQLLFLSCGLLRFPRHREMRAFVSCMA